MPRAEEHAPPNMRLKLAAPRVYGRIAFVTVPVRRRSLGAIRWAGVVPRRAKLEAPAPRDPRPLSSVRPVCAHAVVDTAKVLAFPMLFTRLSGVARQGKKSYPGRGG